MNKEHCPIVILGAGVTGLTLAHHLNKAGKEFIVLDPEPVHGGVVQTKSENGFTYEMGPNSGVIGHPEVVSLFDDLGDRIQLEKGNDLVKIRFVLKDGKWEPLPYNLKLAVNTPLFTWKDKLRICGEPFRSKGENPDETLADLVLRRMGQSFLDYAIDPFILGIYAGDPSRLVTRYALPKLYRLEQDYGSFIKGAMKKRKLPKTELEKRADRSVFSFKGGLKSLSDALLDSAGASNFRFEAKNARVRYENGKFYVRHYWNSDVYEITADKVITTFTSVGLPEALPFVAEPQMKALTNLKYARVVQIALGFDQWEGCNIDGFGGLIPHKEKRDLLGVLFMSSLFSERAPEGGALFSIFMGGIRNEALCDLPDEELMARLEKEFKDIMELENFNPSMVKIRRYYYAIPQYEASTGERLEAIETLQKQYPGLYIAGNLRDGIGMADRIRQATNIAKELTT